MISRTNREHLPLILFGGITLAGVFFIALTKLAGVSALLSMVIPILLMIAYWFLSWYLKRLRLHDEQTGDNLYYMGFLFTLTSLGVSLYQFTSEGTMDEVVRNFGIAITSTIFGIAMRILYNQTRRDVLDIERSTRHDLANMTRQVRTEMESMRREFVDFRRVNHQMLVEGVNEIMESTKETAAKVRKTIDQMVTESVKPLEDASQKLGGTISASLGEISDKLNAVVGRLDTTTKQMESVVLPEAVIKNDLAPLVREMGSSLSRYASDVQTSGNAQTESTRAVSDSISRLVDQMARTMNMLERSIQANGQALQSNAALNQRIEQSSNVQRQMFERIMRDRQHPVLITTGGMPQRPVVAPTPHATTSPLNVPTPRPTQPNAYQSLNASGFPNGTVSATGSMVTPAVANVSTQRTADSSSEESTKA
ncbi:hypothetical protein [Sinorhizobium meliloti]|uniref:hypothetical protein n=1 Tax=Rhizobium meliloti TaxID=382 RepID=UPI000FD79495|nr:hypothetical protein [Sinorhizobium meliloti]MDW9928068.1 hypothetical protein [Sinorhizobium meliloti]MDX0964799.1 hypothetical protein [Sinorhizobium medicae]RVI54948.1 hypothetical protein CN195_04850 [Sinorhizobium meliloti]